MHIVMSTILYTPTAAKLPKIKQVNRLTLEKLNTWTQIFLDGKFQHFIMYKFFFKFIYEFSIANQCSAKSQQGF